MYLNIRNVDDRDDFKVAIGLIHTHAILYKSDADASHELSGLECDLVD